PTVLGLTARLVGNIPENAETVEFFASRAFASVHLTIVDEIRNREARMVLEQGARSTPFEFSDQYEESGRTSVAQQYFWLGVQHIVPNGFDHILFVVGLFLLSLEIRPLVTQVTAFTLAHALTLTAAVLGFVTLSPQLVEPLIAMSVAYIAIENIVTAKLTPWRPFVVFGFGLLHGLGFANSLSVLGLPDQERLLALVMFNAGIEVGQLAVIAAAASSLGWCRNKPWYRPWIVIPASAVIATTGIIWAIERASDL
ncbi:MAG: HupE/UreJ family protein, partial [Vicinamibacterales bacterium]